jgi:hypothetical protein
MYVNNPVISPLPRFKIPVYERIYKDGNKLIGELTGTGRKVVIAYWRKVI